MAPVGHSAGRDESDAGKEPVAASKELPASITDIATNTAPRLVDPTRPPTGAGLGTMLERSFRQAYLLEGGSLAEMVLQPLSLVFLAIAAVAVAVDVRRRVVQRRRAARDRDDHSLPTHRWPGRPRDASGPTTRRTGGTAR